MGSLLLAAAFVSLAALCLPAASQEVFPKPSEAILREMLLSPNGEDINADGVQELAERLAQFTQSGVPSHYSSSREETATEKPQPLLDSYLTVGRRPSTTHFLELSVGCDICASAIHILGPVVAAEKVWEKLTKIAILICPKVTGFTKEVCDGIIELFPPVIHYALPNLIKAPYSLCGKIFTRLGCGAVDHPHSLWTIAIPDPLPDPVKPIDNADAAGDTNTITVLYMTDVQFDMDYSVGSVADCTAPACCRNSSVANGEEGGKAGYWGNRKCDLPVWTLEDMLQHINTTHGDEIDLILYGGDILPQAIWETSAEGNKKYIEFFTSKLDEYMPGKPYYFTVGNHEASPVDAFSLPGDPDEFSNQWLYDKLAEVWIKWLDRNTTEDTIRKAGFYTILLKPGWRLVSLNSVYCYSFDWFLWARNDITDPYGQLQWLTNVLLEAEKKGERVQILSHISGGDGTCLQAWSWNYYRIISRFAHIISGQFHGHSHKDLVSMFYDAETLTQPKAVAFIGPPGTPNDGNNIGYRLYEFDSSTFTLLDYRQYYADIKVENAKADHSRIDWKLEYSAKNVYSLPDMSAKSWSDLLKRMQTNATLFSLYQKHYTLSISDPHEPCGLKCRRIRLCEAYRGLAGTGEEWCERFFPSKNDDEGELSKKRKCSTRFIEKLDP